MSIYLENQSLIGAYKLNCLGNRYPIKTYDDYFGQLYIYRESLGVMGIVRAQSWESAYEIVLDDILTPIPESEVIAAYGFIIMPNNTLKPETSKLFHAYDRNRKKIGVSTSEKEATQYCLDTIVREECELIEGYEYQPNATNTGIVSIDLNGNSLDVLTTDMLIDWDIVLQVESDDY